MTPAERTAEARWLLAKRITECRYATNARLRRENLDAIIAALEDTLAAAWAEGYQARRNDMGAADVTPNPYEKARTGR